jgi:hypothetical protein
VKLDKNALFHAARIAVLKIVFVCLLTKELDDKLVVSRNFKLLKTKTCSGT